MSQVELPYAGTSGYRGSDTSELRARREDNSGATGKRQAETIQALKQAGFHGLTWKELSESTGWHHGKASGVLSVLHKTGHISRLSETRDRCKVYCHPDSVAERKTEEHRGNITPTVHNLSEVNMLTERQVDVLIEGQTSLVHQVDRVMESGGGAEQVLSAVADWLTSYRPQELGDIYCTPLDVTAFILRKGEVRG